MLPDGMTLVVVSDYPAASYALVRAFTSTCAPDLSFGDKGAEHLALGGRDFRIEAAAPASGGGAILAGSSPGGWVVAQMEASGRLDLAFGKGGWTVLPSDGSASAVTQAPSGDIFVGGGLVPGNGPMGIAELNARGTVSKPFGRQGQVVIPEMMDDSELTRVAVEGNGDILGLIAGGNMGNWRTTVNAFRPNGSPVPSFQGQFAAALEYASPDVFVADLITRPGGFLLVGTRQDVPVIAQSPTATGQVVAFEANGSLDTSFAQHGVARFRSPLENPVWALPMQNGGVLMVGQTPYTEATAKAHARLELLGISKQGGLEARYVHGAEEVQLPFLNQSFPASAIPVSVTTDGKMTVVVSSTADGKALKLVQLLG
jgi:hypothetical protein